MRKLLHSKLFIVAIITIILVPSLFLLALRIDFGEREDSVLAYFSEQEGMSEAFAQLKQLTPNDSVVLCWWDYGRAIAEWSQRQVIEAYPSRDIWNSMASSRDPWHALEAQIFGRWGSSEKIHDIARMLMLPEEQSLQLMRNYNVSYALVFTPDDIKKFYWIANIAGYDGADYLTSINNTYTPTNQGAQVTILRLLFDDTLHPTHFTKLYDNSKGKIYRIDYP